MSHRLVRVNGANIINPSLDLFVLFCQTFNIILLANFYIAAIRHAITRHPPDPGSLTFLNNCEHFLHKYKIEVVVNRNNSSFKIMVLKKIFFDDFRGLIYLLLVAETY